MPRISFLATVPRLRLLALFLVVVGARFWLLDRYALPVPNADQWDGIGWRLLQRWQEGALKWQELLAPHNEHRIFLTRLLSLALFQANGQWDNLLECAVDAVFCGGSAVVLAATFGECLRGAFPRTTLLAVALYFVLPFGWENTLNGFQSQNYFLIFFSVLAIWGLGFHRAGTGRWWMGLAGAVLACLSMGSGLIAAGVVLAQGGWRLLRERRWPDAGEVVTAVLCSGIVAAGWLTRVEVPAHAALKAASLSAFLSAFGRFLAWPNYDTTALGILMVAPLALLAWTTFRRAPDEEASRVEPLLAIGGWTILQTAALAYARDAQGTPPACRYMDLLALNPLLGFLCLLALLARWWQESRWVPLAIAAAAAWTLVVLVGLRAETTKDLRGWLPDRLTLLQRGERNLRDFLRTGDRARFLTDRQAAVFLFWNPEWLADAMGNPTLRALLPYDVRLPLTLGATTDVGPGRFVPDGYDPTCGFPDSGRAWGSYPAAGGTTGTFHTPFSSGGLPYLRFAFAGDLGEPGLSFRLRDTAGTKQLSWRPVRVPKNHWRVDFLPAPGRNILLEATDESATGWFAFSEPVEVGRWSYWAGYALRRGTVVLAAGLLLTVGLELALLFRGAREYLAQSSARGATSVP